MWEISVTSHESVSLKEALTLESRRTRSSPLNLFVLLTARLETPRSTTGSRNWIPVATKTRRGMSNTFSTANITLEFANNTCTHECFKISDRFYDDHVPKQALYFSWILILIDRTLDTNLRL